MKWPSFRIFVPSLSFADGFNTSSLFAGFQNLVAFSPSLWLLDISFLVLAWHGLLAQLTAISLACRFDIKNSYILQIQWGKYLAWVNTSLKTLKKLSPVQCLFTIKKTQVWMKRFVRIENCGVQKYKQLRVVNFEANQLKAIQFLRRTGALHELDKSKRKSMTTFCVERHEEGSQIVPDLMSCKSFEKSHNRQKSKNY